MIILGVSAQGADVSLTIGCAAESSARSAQVDEPLLVYKGIDMLEVCRGGCTCTAALCCLLRDWSSAAAAAWAAEASLRSPASASLSSANSSCTGGVARACRSHRRWVPHAVHGSNVACGDVSSWIHGSHHRVCQDAAHGFGHVRQG